MKRGKTIMKNKKGKTMKNNDITKKDKGKY